MNYILLHASYGRESMRMTVDAMTEPCALLLKRSNGDWQQYSPEQKAFSSLRSIMEILRGKNNVINWGNHIFSDDRYFRLNCPSAINRASNKSLGRYILREAGVAIPTTFFHDEDDWFGNLPLIGRPPYHHGGQKFYVLNSPNDCINLGKKYDLGGWYFSEIFNKDTEFRVHCAHGKVLLIQEKPLVPGELRANQAVNHESWRVLKWSEYNLKVCTESLKAIEALGLDYGAVDIMYNSKTNDVAICEVNTSPSINTPYTSQKYGDYFSWVIRHNFPAHFSIDDNPTFYSKLLRE